MFLFVLPLLTLAVVRITQPKWLVDQFQYTGLPGEISASTAAFGAPFYGERVKGRAFYSAPTNDYDAHCGRQGYTNVTQFEEKMKDEKSLRNIVVVQRYGVCTDVTKVSVAVSLGADAVIVIDTSTSGLTSDTIHTHTMGADRRGTHIHIPTLLISFQDGDRLVKALQEGQEDVNIELHWDIPQDVVTTLDYWFSAADPEANAFLTEFRPFALALMHDVEFIPHFAIESSSFASDCYDTAYKYCAKDPDKDGPITGKEVVEESLRQLCIWETHAEGKVVLEKMTPSEIMHARHYWNYVAKIHTMCPLTSDDPSTRFGSAPCSETVMKSVDVDVDKVNDCIREQGTALLELQRINNWRFGEPIHINGWRYEGGLIARVVAKGICAAFIEPIGVCQKWRASDFDVNATEFSFLWIAGVAICVLGLVCGAVKCFKYVYGRNLRREVKVHVQTQMAEYRKLDEDGEVELRRNGPRLLGKVGRLPNLSRREALDV